MVSGSEISSGVVALGSVVALLASCKVERVTAKVMYFIAVTIVITRKTIITALFIKIIIPSHDSQKFGAMSKSSVNNGSLLFSKLLNLFYQCR